MSKLVLGILGIFATFGALYALASYALREAPQASSPPGDPGNERKTDAIQRLFFMAACLTSSLYSTGPTLQAALRDGPLPAVAIGSLAVVWSFRKKLIDVEISYYWAWATAFEAQMFSALAVAAYPTALSTSGRTALTLLVSILFIFLCAGILGALRSTDWVSEFSVKLISTIPATWLLHEVWLSPTCLAEPRFHRLVSSTGVVLSLLLLELFAVLYMESFDPEIGDDLDLFTLPL